MKVNRNYIKIMTILFLVIGLYSFTNHRNGERPLFKEVDIAFTDDDALYITREAVNKLLIQNDGIVTGMAKEKVVLNALEDALNANKTIQDAHVYVTVNGRLKVKIKQKTPIARVGGETSFYITDNGETMPLSSVFSARVPLITGITDKQRLTDVYTLAMYIHDDEFLKKNVIGIHQQGYYFELRFRVDDFVVKLGDAHQLEAKFNNLKAFYQKARKDNTLYKYGIVNLAYHNQIVCTKK
ncbi:MAG: hypothetical protein KDD04_06170 [Sinomicrobium sp.]|nr:hypothetical protein [Sinomicrobium sp.]